MVRNEGRKTPTECALKQVMLKGQYMYARLNSARKQVPTVVKYIGELRSEIQKKYEITFEKHITELGRIREEALAKELSAQWRMQRLLEEKQQAISIEQKITTVR